MSPVIDKAALRRTLLAHREAYRHVNNNVINQSIKENVLQIANVEKAAVAFVYVSLAGEVETHGLIDRLTAMGITVLVPRLIDKARMQAMEFPGWDVMEPGPMGILAPPAGPSWKHGIDVAIIPGLGFSLAGDRLGFGAGFYDRWLSLHDESLKVGLGYDYQIVPEIPVAAHDVKMDLIVTESRLVWIDTA